MSLLTDFDFPGDLPRLLKVEMVNPEHVVNVETQQGLDLWYDLLRYRLCLVRNCRSDLSGRPLSKGFEIHHGIVTRKDVQGADWKFRINCEFNCFLLRPEEHRPEPPSREWAVERAVELYGKQKIRLWYYGLPWKTGEPPRHFPDLLG